MRIGVPKEIAAGETRVAIVPESCKKLVKAGVTITIQAGAGAAAFIPDEEYSAAGAQIEADPAAVLSGADFVFKVQAPVHSAAMNKHEIDAIREGAKLICTLLPTRNTDAVKRLAARKVSAFATDFIPRTTRAQSMDTLSSQANISGYKAVVLAAQLLPKYFPMLMTAAGTVFAAKVFIIGAGVAGLQAIATARRMGANVLATDTRREVAEQIHSLGAKFVGVETQEDATTASGYAKELSQDFYRKQGELIAQQCAAHDVVITTALIGGVKAPKLITEEMVKGMKQGAVIVDLAAEAGGNCVLTEPGQTVVRHGVTIAGPSNLPAEMPRDASMLFSRNLTTFVLEFWKDKAFNLDLNDEIIKGALITHEGRIVNEMVSKALSSGGAA